MSADSAGRSWNWSDDADDVVVPEQPPVAVYTNPKGAVVVRQRADVFDDDSWIWFGSDHAPAVAAAILQAAGMGATALMPEPAQGDGKPRDATGAERQRRRRARQKEPLLDIERDQDRDVTAANRDSVTDHNDRNGAGDGQDA